MRPKAGAARNRRRDGRVVELRPRGVDRRGVGGDRGGELQHRAHSACRAAAWWRSPAWRAWRSASRSSLGVGEIGLVLRFLGHRLLERGLEGPRIDLGEQVALLDHLAFLEGDLHDLAVDPGADHNGVVGLDLADALKDDREIGALDRRDGDDDRRGARAFAAAGSSRRGRGLSGRGPDLVVQLMGESAGGRKPPVRRFGRVNAIGGGRAARQLWRSTANPAEPHRRTAFLAPQRSAQTKRFHALRRARRGALRRTPGAQRFPDAGSRGICAHNIFLGARWTTSTKFDWPRSFRASAFGAATRSKMRRSAG